MKWLKKEDIKNIYCVGRNFDLHVKELGNTVLGEPMIFIKPTHAYVPLEGQLELPLNQGALHFETELVLLVGRPYEEGLTIKDFIDGIALGLDFTLRDVQEKIKKQGRPWLPAKGFQQSAAVTAFRSVPQENLLYETSFSLYVNGEERQRGNCNEMIFSLQSIVEYIGQNYGLGKGDLIFTGTPSGVGEAAKGDRFELFWGDESWGTATIAAQRWNL